LEISALGKKRHRVDFARQLTAGSLLKSFEANKDVAYVRGEREANKLIQFLDPSLPWWSRRDRWARWTTPLPIAAESLDRGLSLTESVLNVVSLGPDRPSLFATSSDAPLSFSRALGTFLAGRSGRSPPVRELSASVLYFPVPYHRMLIYSVVRATCFTMQTLPNTTMPTSMHRR
jgi:hypothetical protein